MDSIVAQAEALFAKVAASVLWKYADPEGNEFYLLKKLTPVRSPYSGKSFTVKPERVSLSDIGKELKSDAKAEKAKKADDGDFWKAAFFAEPIEAHTIDLNAEIPVSDLALNKLGAEAKGKTLPGTLWEYADEDGNKFYLPKKHVGALKSPFTGKTFTGKPVKNTLSDVGKDLKQEAKSKKASEDQGSQGAEQQEAQDKEASADPWKVEPSFAVLAQQEEANDEPQQKQACAPGQCKCGGQCGCSTMAEGEQEQKKEATEAEAILAQGESHPALKVLLAAYQDVVATVAQANELNQSVKASALEPGVKQDAAGVFVLARVKPAVEKLARVSAIVAKQMEAKIK